MGHPIPMSHWDGMGLPGMSTTIPPPEAFIPTVHPIPMSHWDGLGLPGMSHLQRPSSQLSIPSRCPIGTGWDCLGCPTSRGLHPNCPSHPDVPSGRDGTAWDVPSPEALIQLSIPGKMGLPEIIGVHAPMWPTCKSGFVSLIFAEF